MKKKFLLLSFMLLFIFTVFTISAQAAPNDIKVTVDGKQISFTDAKPFIDKNYRTLVPMRALGEALGCDVGYSNQQITLTKKARNNVMYKTRVQTGSNILNFYVEDINADNTYMDTYTILKNNRAYLPARYVAQRFGYDVNYNENSKTVVITSAKQSYMTDPAYGADVSDLEGKWIQNYFLGGSDSAIVEIVDIGNNQVMLTETITNENIGETYMDTYYYTVKGIDKTKGKIYLEGEYGESLTFLFYKNNFAMVLYDIQDTGAYAFNKIS